MVTLAIVDDNLYKTQRMVSEYVLLARVYGKEFAYSNRAIEINIINEHNHTPRCSYETSAAGLS